MLFLCNQLMPTIYHCKIQRKLIKYLFKIRAAKCVSVKYDLKKFNNWDFNDWYTYAIIHYQFMLILLIPIIPPAAASHLITSLITTSCSQQPLVTRITPQHMPS